MRGKAAPRKRERGDDAAEPVTRPLPEEACALPSGLADMQEVLEKAELESLRRRMSVGSVRLLELGAALPPALEGLCRSRLQPDDFAALTALHDSICSKLEGSFARWGGLADSSGRLRGYGYVRGTMGETKFGSAHELSMREYTGAEAAADRAANARASVLLDSLPADAERALTTLCAQLRPLLPARYGRFLSFDNLVAAQPNLHNGRAYLRVRPRTHAPPAARSAAPLPVARAVPQWRVCSHLAPTPTPQPHLDEPLHDGFGIVIVTLAVRGAAHIVLRSQPWDAAREAEYSFPLQARAAAAAAAA